MKAGWYEKNGAAKDVLMVGERPDPTPSPGEVLVRVAVSGVNPSDVKRRQGSAGAPLAFPYAVPNNDGAGAIVAVGDGVDTKRIGERVWLHSTGWKRQLGTAAELTVTPAWRAIRLPDSVSFEIGAGLGVPAMTAHRAVHGCGPVRGATVLVTGGAGAVGFYAIQLAKRAGATVIATVSSDAKAAEARRAGAHHVVSYRTEDVAARVMAITSGAGANHVVDVDFGANLDTTMKLVADNGSIATYASMGAPEPKIPFYPMMFKNIRLLWVFVYEMPRTAMDEAAEEITAWLQSGGAAHPAVHRHALADLVAAHEAVEAGAVGKVVVTI